MCGVVYKTDCGKETKRFDLFPPLCLPSHRTGWLARLLVCMCPRYTLLYYPFKNPSSVTSIIEKSGFVMHTIPLATLLLAANATCWICVKSGWQVLWCSAEQTDLKTASPHSRVHPRTCQLQIFVIMLPYKLWAPSKFQTSSSSPIPLTNYM